ncbi:MAG: hypothetical protein PHC46_02660 [Clostridia bacterium]|nr:hypothetical protein [Clostridia bacterium]
MKTRRDIDEIAKMNKPPQNMVVSNLKTGKDKIGNIKVYDSAVNLWASIISNALVDYAKKGGDMDNLNFSKVFNNNFKNKE